MQGGRRLQPKKCHEFETDLGDIVVRQLRKPRSYKIDASRAVRPYDTVVGVTLRVGIS